jgi:biopolymer transport protein ExbD
MAIYAPAKRINPSIRRRGKDRKGVYATLFLTSMVDMFAILVIFLLQSFSSEGELIILPQGLQLPKVQNVGGLSQAPSLVLSLEELLLDGKVIAQTKDILASADWNVPELQQVLVDKKAELEATTAAFAELTEEAKLNLQKINISADRRLNFEAVKKIIYTAGFAGFPIYQLAVFQGKAPDPQN